MHSPLDPHCNHCCKLCHSRLILARTKMSNSLSQFGLFLQPQQQSKMPSNYHIDLDS
uniref:Uncharacterized protein n=1 Tax=Medicago truncatula TaxID=3880 RepID=I3S9Z5_MEDTR|nr:unknown [Medicago truncatula]